MFWTKKNKENRQYRNMLERCVAPDAKIVQEADERGERVIWLRKEDGQYFCTITNTTPWGELGCYIYWEHEVGYCILLENGKVKGSYIKEWKWANEPSQDKNKEESK